MTAKEYLRSFAKKKTDTEVLEERIRELERKRSQLRAMKCSEADDRTQTQTELSEADTVISTLIEEYKTNIIKCAREESRIRARIDEMIDPEERKVLRLLYVIDKELTWYEIAEELNVSKRTAQNIHGRALEHFKMP